MRAFAVVLSTSALGLALASACGSGGSSSAASTTASTASSSSSSTGGSGGTGGAGGAGGAACASMCAVAKKCGGASATCAGDCATLRGGPCGSKLDALEACFAKNLAELEACGRSHACDAETSAYQSCVSLDEPSSTSSTTSGSGGFSSGCDMPSCISSPNGLCSCTRDCFGENDGFSCITIPGGLYCSCVVAGVPPAGECLEKADACGTFEGNCCEKNP